MIFTSPPNSYYEPNLNMSNLPKSLIEKYKDGKIIPFVGAGVSMSVKNTDGKNLFSSWWSFLNDCIKSLKEEKTEGYDQIIDGPVFRIKIQQKNKGLKINKL